MINKPKPEVSPKNNYFFTFLMEMTDIFGSERVTQTCLKYGKLKSF